LKGLKGLILWRTKVTSAGVTEFRKVMPNVKVLQ